MIDVLESSSNSCVMTTHAVFRIFCFPRNAKTNIGFFAEKAKNVKLEIISHKNRSSDKNFSLYVKMVKLNFLKLQFLHFNCNKRAIKHMSDCNDFFSARKLSI